MNKQVSGSNLYQRFVAQKKSDQSPHLGFGDPQALRDLLRRWRCEASGRIIVGDGGEFPCVGAGNLRPHSERKNEIAFNA